MVNHLKICICIELAFFFYGTYGYAVSLQALSRILVVVPFRVYYIINLPIKYVLVVLGSDSIMIRSRNAACHRSATKCKKCEGSVKSAKGVLNRCDRVYTLIL